MTTEQCTQTNRLQALESTKVSIKTFWGTVGVVLALAGFVGTTYAGRMDDKLQNSEKDFARLEGELKAYKSDMTTEIKGFRTDTKKMSEAIIEIKTILNNIIDRE